ncbi:GPO family capsid scaffolding protein [Pseudomonas huaxiensis]|uniref:GPO family capsid scaffolding protein n=1 Tax=Pseudomonas huaxiensis TaxID=2213017 RepID=UPI000DA6C689|nr:GPO family capsid scaffolding protein [Pseudomonas huaxiensis]
MAASTAPTKKLRSKFFRVALEGSTTDGRVIERDWITQIVDSYDRNLFGARINCEHIKSLLPDSPFGAYGDVIAVKAEDFTIGGKTKLALLAQIEPNEALIELNKKKQKIYSSIEVDPEFADTGGAYLRGLAITDNPASLGTEALEFSAKHGTFANRKSSENTLFTAAEEVVLEFEEVADSAGMFAGLREKVSGLLNKSKEKEGKDAASFTALGELIEQIATHGAEQAEAFAAEQKAREDLQAKHDKLSTDFNELVERLGKTADHTQQQRPPMAGGDGKVVAEF